MGLFSSTNYKDKYIQTLESRISQLEADLKAVRDENSRLVSRLLLKNQVPVADDKSNLDDVKKLIANANIFEEEDDPTEIEDNRKETLDAFAS